MSNEDELDKMNKLSKVIVKMYKKPMRYIDDLERWIAYRTYDKYNVIKIPTLTPHYYDKDHIFLHGCFALLTDYVEVELGCRSKSNRNYEKEVEQEEALREKGHKILASILEYWHDTRFLPRFISNLFDRRECSRETGLEYIEEAMKLEPQFPDDPRDVEWTQKHIDTYREIKELYLWWHDNYLKRKDEMDEVGLSDFYDKIRSKYGETHVFTPTSPSKKAYTMDFVGSKEEEEELDKLHKKSWELEAARDKEDEEMLLRLVKIRRSLWT